MLDCCALFSFSLQLQYFSTERQVQAVLAVLLICISFEIAGNPFALVNERYKILGRLELSTLFVQWATMWCGSMIYASQDPDSKGFVVFLTVVVATMNIGMLVWLVLRLLGECVREQREDRRRKNEEGDPLDVDDGRDGSDGNRCIAMMSDLDLAVKRWRFGRMSEDARQTRIRRRTVDANDRSGMQTSENPAMQMIEMANRTIVVESNDGEINVEIDSETLSVVVVDRNVDIANMAVNPLQALQRRR